MSQGSMSLLDISVSDDEETRKHKACMSLLVRVTLTSRHGKTNSSVMGRWVCKNRDNVVNDYADGGKRKPKNHNFFGPPFTYMEEHGVFKPLPSTTNPLGLCHFYPMDPTIVTMLTTSEAASQGGPYQESVSSCQDTASSVYHHCVQRWRNYSIEIIAGTAYSERACSYSYLPA